VPKDSSVFAAGDPVFWNADRQPGRRHGQQRRREFDADSLLHGLRPARRRGPDRRRDGQVVLTASEGSATSAWHADDPVGDGGGDRQQTRARRQP
jgi:hypothetical protein